jgi:hypothetical protein
MQIVRDVINNLKAMKYSASDISELSPIFNGFKFNVIDDFVEELKNDSLEMDKRQPSDRLLRASLGFQIRRN